MSRWVVAIIVVVLAVLAVPVLLVLALVPLRVETGAALGQSNSVPADLRALTVHDRLAIDLSWTPVEPGTATYVLQRSTSADGPWEDVVVVEPTAARYLDDGLEDGVTYFYRIAASDPDGGSGKSNTTSATATDLPTPE